MNNKLVPALILIGFLTATAGAATVNDIGIIGQQPATTAGDQVNLLQVSNQISTINSRLEGLPSKADMDSSFQQIDKKIADISRNDLTATLIFLILNDVALISGFVILKSREMI